MAARRRLPVIQSAPSPSPPHGGPDPKGNAPDDDPDAIEKRPPWHWVGFGTVAIFAVWLPLAYVAQALVARVLAGRFGASASAESVASSLALMPAGERARLMAFLALPNVAAIGVASFAGGFLVGRYGAGTGPREAGTAGAMTALVALVLALGGSAGGGAAGAAAVATAVVIVLLTIGFAAWGGRVGVRRRAA